MNDLPRIKLTDFAELKRLSNLDVSPSGRRAVFSVRDTDLERDCYRNRLVLWDNDHLRDLREGSSAFFETEDSLLLPVSDKGGTRYDRLSLSDGSVATAFSIPLHTGTLRPVGDGLWLCSAEHSLADESEFPENHDDFEVLEEVPFRYNGKGYLGRKRNGLYLCDTRNGTQKLLTEPDFELKGFQVHRDKAKALYWGIRYDFVERQKQILYLLDLKTLAAEPLTDDGMRIDSACFDGDIVILKQTLDSVSPGQICRLDPATKEQTVLMDDLDGGEPDTDTDAGGSVWKRPDGHCRNDMRDSLHNRYIRLYPDGTKKTLIDETDYLGAVAGEEGALYYFGANRGETYELYRKDASGVRRLTDFNTRFLATRTVPVPEYVTCTTRDGTELDGFILRPAGMGAADKLPAILVIHGGPCDHYSDVFSHQMQALCAEGYILFFCNPRGSNGKGHEFTKIHGEKYGVVDFNDLMDFTDFAVRTVPQIDEKRLGIIGGSYGGFMVNWAIGHTDRFRAAVSLRGNGDFLGGSLQTDVGYFHTFATLQADPWKDPMAMWYHSPVAWANHVKTPTLFIHSDEDYRCPASGPMEMFAGLLLHGVPARMLLVHGECHSLARLGKPSRRKRRLEEIFRWFRKYL